MAAVKVAILSPGSMGAAVGAHLRSHGASVSTCLIGRSVSSADRARAAGIGVVADEVELVGSADVFLSIVPPGAAAETAERIAAAMRRAARAPVYAECNAIAPETARAIGRTVGAVGAPYVDAGIVGGPPRPGGSGPRFYASGPELSGLLSLRAHGLDVRPVGSEIGQASALKMCYAMWSKGSAALAVQLLVAARLTGVSEALLAQFHESDPEFIPGMERRLPGMPPKAYRWVAEMEEMAKTLEACGLPRETFMGAARLYELVARSPLGGETTERRERGKTLEDVVETLAAWCAAPAAQRSGGGSA
jgi:3-hydroxyisobutyrate dehydrogenase-like beta-hydroxyacid dehydrogenase